MLIIWFFHIYLPSKGSGQILGMSYWDFTLLATAVTCLPAALMPEGLLVPIVVFLFWPAIAVVGGFLGAMLVATVAALFLDLTACWAGRQLLRLFAFGREGLHRAT